MKWFSIILSEQNVKQERSEIEMNQIVFWRSVKKRKLKEFYGIVIHAHDES